MTRDNGDREARAAQQQRPVNRAARQGKATQDEQLLSTPEPTERLFTHTDPWRVLRITGEFVEGFDAMAEVGPAISIFGSARVKPDDPMYQAAVETARLLGEAGLAIITGGGPGIMEAGNRGAQLAGAPSIGLNIELPFEQGTNRYVELAIDFHYFFVRKTIFVKYASAFVIFPGGFGTMDELFEALTLIQTGKIHNFPVILFGSDYWAGMLDWIRQTMQIEKKIGPADIDLMKVTDDPAEVRDLILTFLRDPDQCQEREQAAREEARQAYSRERS